MLTQILDEASHVMSSTLLTDVLNIYSPGENKVTDDFEDVRTLELRVEDVPCLVQTTSTTDATSGLVSRYFSVKVGKDVDLRAGDYVTVIKCDRDSSLVGKTLLVDNVSFNGMSLIKKGKANEFETVNSEGKTNAS